LSIKTTGTFILLVAMLVYMPTVSLAGQEIDRHSIVSGPDAFAADSCSGALSGTNYPGDVVEPYVAVSANGPRGQQRFIVVYQQDRWNTGGSRGIMSAWSYVNRLSWHTVPLPFSRCTPDGPQQTRASNAWVSIGTDGTAYAAALMFDEQKDSDGSFSSSPALGVSSSTDGGQTWRTPVVLAPNSADKDAITVDPTQAGTAYIVWNGASDATHGHLFSKTTDGGRTWAAPTVISPLNGAQGSMGGQILVDPHRRTLLDVHELLRPVYTRTMQVSGYDGWTVVSVSTDGGNTWRMQKVAKQRPMGPLHSADNIAVPPLRDAGGMPSGAIDPITGELYVVWQDARFTRGRRADIVIAASNDSGMHWTAPHLVAPRDTRREFDPQVAVGAAGTVGVSYYAMRNLKGSRPPLTTRYIFAESHDRAAHFPRKKVLDGPFDMRNVPQVSGYFVGDYVGLVASGKDFLSVFVTPRHGTLTEIKAYRMGG
jgi:hypothetical protein